MITTPHTVVLQKNLNYHDFGVYIGDDVPTGIYVVTIKPNSPAAVTNIQPGDRILAVDGQLVSTMCKHPKEMVVQLAKSAQSLTLSIEPSDILQTIGMMSTNDFYNDPYQYISKQNNGIDPDLENYIKSVFINENLQILPAYASNSNEYILISDLYSFQPHRRRRRRKRSSLKTAETQTLFIEESKASFQPLSRHRSIPSMGTSHVMLRNSQINSKDNRPNELPEVQYLPNIPTTISNPNFDINKKVTYTPEPISPAMQSFNPSLQLSDNRVITQENSQPSYPPMQSFNPSLQLSDNRVITQENSQPSYPHIQSFNPSLQLSNNRVITQENSQPSYPPIQSFNPSLQLSDNQVIAQEYPQASYPPINLQSFNPSPQLSNNQVITQEYPQASYPPIQSFNPSPQLSNNQVITQEYSQPSYPPIQSFNASPQLSNNRVITQENPQQTSEISNRPSWVGYGPPPPPVDDDDGLHEVFLRRSPNFNGYGFHLQYNRAFYIIHHVEPNSPAERSGLRENDVIRRVNNQTTEKMSHKTFVQIINPTQEVVFLVQSHDNFVRTNPHLLQQQTNRSAMETPVNNNQQDGDTRQNVFSKAFRKLTSR